MQSEEESLVLMGLTVLLLKGTKQVAEGNTFMSVYFPYQEMPVRRVWDGAVETSENGMADILVFRKFDLFLNDTKFEHFHHIL